VHSTVKQNISSGVQMFATLTHAKKTSQQMIYNPEIGIQFKYPAWWTEQMSTLVDQKEQLHKNKV
jgi:hypothetical protein